jgi:hypothetical protein
MSIREHVLKYPNGYRCDNWVVIFINGDDPHYRVLTGTSGGYTTGSSWRMNSGIVKVEEDEYFYYFLGASGSCYICHKEAYGLRMNNAHIWSQLQVQHEEKVKLMDDDTDWLNHDWIIS